MIYVDTNVFVHAVENHPKFGKSCKRILEDVEDGKLEASCSILVLVASMELNSTNEILSADRDFDRVPMVKRKDPLEYK